MIRVILFASVLGLFLASSNASAACAKCSQGECETTVESGGCECKTRLRIIGGVAHYFCRTTGECSASNNSCDNNDGIPAVVLDPSGQPVRIAVPGWVIEEHLAEDPLLGAVLLALVDEDNGLQPMEARGSVAREPGARVRTIPAFDYEASLVDRGDGTLGVDVAVMVEGQDRVSMVQGWVGEGSGMMTVAGGTADQRQTSWAHDPREP